MVFEWKAFLYLKESFIKMPAVLKELMQEFNLSFTSSFLTKVALLLPGSRAMPCLDGTVAR